MKNFNLRTGAVALTLAGSLVFSCAGCRNPRRVEKNEVKTKITSMDMNYDDGHDNIDYSKTETRIFEPGEHILMFKVDGKMDYDSLVQVDPIDGYEIIDANYQENPVGSAGLVYSFYTFTYQNADTVEAIGYYDKDKDEYVYNQFGTVYEKEHVKIR